MNAGDRRATCLLTLALIVAVVLVEVAVLYAIWQAVT